MTTPRRLKGHTAETTCCISSRAQPGVVFTAAEDGCVCLFDMRCKDVQSVMKLENDAISSLCFKHENENMIYVSTGTEVRCFDIHMASDSKPLESYNYNKEEINQISCNSKASFIAAADDSSDVKIIDIQQRRPFKTLRSGHASICSSVQFLPWKPWEVITGGLDSKIIMWDYSKGRPFLVVDFGNLKSGSTGQFYNPAFIHAIAVPEADMLDKVGKACVVARGDGVVTLLNLESELAAVKSKGAAKSRKSSETKSKSQLTGEDVEAKDQNERKGLHLDYSYGGHIAAASCVTFSSFGEKGKLIISGGNDKSVKIWDWSQCLDDALTSKGSKYVASSIDLPKKVNWLCTTPSDSENLVVCDTSKVVKVYTIS